MVQSQNIRKPPWLSHCITKQGDKSQQKRDGCAIVISVVPEWHVIPALSFISHALLRLNACVQCIGCLKSNMCYDRNLACDGQTAQWSLLCHAKWTKRLSFIGGYPSSTIMQLYTFLTSVQCQLLWDQTCNWDNHIQAPFVYSMVWKLQYVKVDCICNRK